MNLKKMSLLSGIIAFPAGFAKDAQIEIDNIFANLWLMKKQQLSIHPLKNYICVKNTHIDSLFEILFRSHIVTDIRLVLQESSVKNKTELNSVCNKIQWENFIDTNYPIKIKVDSIGSKLFHEGAMKEIILNSSLSTYIEKFQNSHQEGKIKNKNNHILSNHLFFELLNNKLTISVSLSGYELYKRNYKKSLSAVAPLREDIAYICLQKTIQFLFSINKQKNIHTLFVPFGGSGTFIFEYLILALQIKSNFFSKKFIFESTPLFKEKTIEFLNKKSLQESEKINLALRKIIYADISEIALKAFTENCENFWKLLQEQSSILYNHRNKIKIDSQIDNFLDLDINNFIKNINFDETVLLPINPPYGLRLQSKANINKLYTKIAEKLNEIFSNVKNKNAILCGFILCPSEETWSIITNKLHTNLKETFHFTQGGLHIRACMFINPK